MSLTVFEKYMKFVDQALAAKADLPIELDAIELESILVSHGVVLLYARMEQCFQQALECKCNRCADLEVRTFALSVKSEKTGKLLLEAVKGTFKRLGINHRTNLTPDLAALNITDSWDSIVNVRQRVAHHGEHASLTLKDLRNYYEDIRKVLGCICKVLTLTEAETQAICTLIEWPAAPALVSPSPSAS